MSKADNYVGKQFNCKGVGLIEVIEKVLKSITKVVVKEIDRGQGYDETKEKYTGVKIRKGWFRGQNFDFGKTHEVHINDLSQIK